MAEFQIVYWRAIPSMVVAREDRRTRHSVELGARFQVAIDEFAMRLGVTGTDAYLEGWTRSQWEERPGSCKDVASQVAAELERDYPAERVRAWIEVGGTAAGPVRDEDASTAVAKRNGENNE